MRRILCIDIYQIKSIWELFLQNYINWGIIVFKNNPKFSDCAFVIKFFEIF